MHRAAFLIALLLIPALITASAGQDESLPRLQLVAKSRQIPLSRSALLG